MPRPWLRHPPATIRPTTCPSGLPRYATVRLASAAVLGHVGAARLAPACCDRCGGVHLQAA
jgi:hypothetical protein